MPDARRCLVPGGARCVAMEADQCDHRGKTVDERIFRLGLEWLTGANSSPPIQLKALWRRSDVNALKSAKKR